jgi:hypothetical protein
MRQTLRRKKEHAFPPHGDRYCFILPVFLKLPVATPPFPLPELPFPAINVSISLAAKAVEVVHKADHKETLQYLGVIVLDIIFPYVTADSFVLVEYIVYAKPDFAIALLKDQQGGAGIP